jgi:hypothetical protein
MEFSPDHERKGRTTSVQILYGGIRKKIARKSKWLSLIFNALNTNFNI